MAEPWVKEWIAKLTDYSLQYYFLLRYNVDTSLKQPGLQKAHLIALCPGVFSSLTQASSHFPLPLHRWGDSLLSCLIYRPPSAPTSHSLIYGPETRQYCCQCKYLQATALYSISTLTWATSLCLKCCLPNWITIEYLKKYIYSILLASLKLLQMTGGLGRQIPLCTHGTKKIRGSQTKYIK